MHPRPPYIASDKTVSYKVIFLFLVSFCWFLSLSNCLMHAAILSSYIYFLISHPFNPLFIYLYPSCSFVTVFSVYGPSVPFTSYPDPFTLPPYNLPILPTPLLTLPPLPTTVYVNPPFLTRTSINPPILTHTSLNPPFLTPPLDAPSIIPGSSEILTFYARKKQLFQLTENETEHPIVHLVMRILLHKDLKEQ